MIDQLIERDTFSSKSRKKKKVFLNYKVLMRYDKNLSKYVPTHCIALSFFFKSDRKINNYLNLLSYPSSSIKKTTRFTFGKQVCF